MTCSNVRNRAAIRSILLISVVAAGIEGSIPTPVLGRFRWFQHYRKHECYED